MKNNGFPGGTVVKKSSARAGHARDVGLIPGLERSPGRRNSNPLQCSCLQNPMDRGAWWTTVHGVSESWTRLSTRAHTHTHTHTIENNQISLVQETKFPGKNNCKE